MDDTRKLMTAAEERGAAAYILSTAADGRPHATYARVRCEADRFVIEEVGRQTASNADARPLVSLLYPVRSAGDYSLIVDGIATVETETQRILVTPTRAVLHRSGTPSDPSSKCTADCVPLFPVAGK